MDDTKTGEKRKLVSDFLERGLLLGSDLVANPSILAGQGPDKFEGSGFVVLTKEGITPGNAVPLGLAAEADRAIVMLQKKRGDSELRRIISLTARPEQRSQGTATARGATEHEGAVRVVSTYNEKPKKKEVQDFVDHFITRFRSLEKLLRNRQELSSTTSIARVLQKREREQVSVIGMVRAKQVTKSGNISLVTEDLTGEINVIVNKSNARLYEKAANTTPDEVLGIVGSNSRNAIFASNLIMPDVPVRELKKCNDEAYAIFLSDLHVGSKYFLKDKLEKFLKWINLETGNEEQQRIARNVKYVFVAGDIVDGVGIYPSQESELEVADVKKQYEEAYNYLRRIPGHIRLIICPGNHDSMRISEPQPVFYREFSNIFLDLENATYVSNPALVNIHSSEGFSGFDVLLYHGYSFDYYIANIESIRFNGGYDRADLVMKYLLQRRHLAPTHTSTLYIPDPDRDHLVIEQVPDFFVSGHLHKTSVTQYRSTTLICGSCWQDTTSFQIKIGHHPEPGRVPIANLKTREMRILRF
jgi:DNA polymerase II small subunit